MSRDLQLTPAQRDRVGDILRESRFKVREQQLEYQKHRHQLFWQALTQVREMLTPEQQKIFDREFARPWMMHSGGHVHGDHDHGPADDFAELRLGLGEAVDARADAGSAAKITARG